MKTRRLMAAVAAGSMAVVAFVASTSPASATTCAWHREHPNLPLPEKCLPTTTVDDEKPATTTTKKPGEATTTTKAAGGATTTTAKPKTETAVKAEAVKARPRYTG